MRVLQRLCGVKCVLYLGKLGSLQGYDMPNKVLATGNTSCVNGEMITWTNVLQGALKAQGHKQQLPGDEKCHGVVRYGTHYTLPSVLQETKAWLANHIDQYDWVEPEIGNMAIASLDGKTEFGYLHIVSDNLAKKYVHDLSNEREQKVLQNRKQLLQHIQGVLGNFFEEYDSRPR